MVPGSSQVEARPLVVGQRLLTPNKRPHGARITMRGAGGNTGEESLLA
jgi:hypothetical protein